MAPFTAVTFPFPLSEISVTAFPEPVVSVVTPGRAERTPLASTVRLSPTITPPRVPVVAFGNV